MFLKHLAIYCKMSSLLFQETKQLLVVKYIIQLIIVYVNAFFQKIKIIFKGDINMFPERLKTLRSEAKLTQKEIADKLNISQQAYANWEKGKTLPANKNLTKLSEMLNTSTDYLLGKTDQVKKSTFDEDLEKSLNSFHSFSGKEMSDEDREVIKQWLIDNFKDKY